MVTRLSRLLSRPTRSIIFASTALKYAADICLLAALSDQTTSDDFAIVDAKPVRGVLGPGGASQVAVRTRTGGTASAPEYTYELYMYHHYLYQVSGQWKPSQKSTKCLGITFELLEKLLNCGHLPDGEPPRPNLRDVFETSGVTSEA